MPTLEALRAEEFDCVRRHFRPERRVLEIGGGSGYQASLIASTGAAVESIDVAPGTETHFPVRLYGGGALPFPDQYFDVVFSSNVLEHIPDLDLSLAEIRRVMKPDALAIHILPTPAWRAWTSLSHYIHIGRRIVGVLAGRGYAARASPVPAVTAVGPRGWRALRRLLADGPHGEYPSALAELWYFSRRRWRQLFFDHGFELLEDWPSGIFYTGYGIFPALSVERRRKLAGVLGSATRVFIMRKRP
ncbi:MAG: class I SAM-dependent methyltransferase [Pseudomonadota bacterium]